MIMQTDVQHDPDFATGKKQGLDVQKIRQDFPMLQYRQNGKQMIYFDSAATNHKPQVVIDRLNYLYTKQYGKPQEQHELSKMMSEEVDNTRSKFADFLNARHSEEIIFTKGCTESINIVAQGFGRALLKAGDEILITEMEHHANIVPWQMACSFSGAILKVVPVSEHGEINLEDFQEQLSNRTKIISVSHTSHAFGTKSPVEDIIKIAHERNIPVLIDAAQTAPHMRIDVSEMDCDFLTFSVHKMGGPAGVGVLYGKKEWLNKIPPHNGGSENTKSVTFEKSEFQPLPKKFEAGTPAFEEIAATGALIDYVREIDMKKTEKYERELLKYATEKVRNLPGVKIYGDTDEKEPVLSFVIENIESTKLATFLSDEHNINVRAGKLSAEPVMKKHNIPELLRVSVCYYNTREEIDTFVAAVEEYLDRQ